MFFKKLKVKLFKKFNNDYYKLFFDNTDDMLCVANLNGYFEKLNKKFIEKLGYSEKELYGRKFIDFIHPDDIPDTLESINDLKKGINV